MNTTAHKFKKNPNCVYRHADLGGVVTIEHSHYPDKVFELTARERRTHSSINGIPVLITKDTIEFNTELTTDFPFGGER